MEPSIEYKIVLPDNPFTIGVFLSGGLDSAILYYILLKLNAGKHTIVPLTLVKNVHSVKFAQNILNYIHSSLSLPPAPIKVLPGVDVKNSINEMYSDGFQQVYVGQIKELPEFLVGWESTAHPENRFFKAPFKNLTKAEIVKLVIEQKQETLFYLTHTCATQEVGRCGECNRCRERKWAFDSLALTDPGVL